MRSLVVLALLAGAALPSGAIAAHAQPAPPFVVSKTARRGTVTLRIDAGASLGVTSTVVAREGAVLCQGILDVCVERNLPGHRTYVYSLVNVDESGASAPLFVRVRMPNTPPTVTLRGSRLLRAGAPARFSVTSSDRDGDALSFRWRVDGRRIAGPGNPLASRLAQPGRHRVEVDARDRFGGKATAGLTILVVA